MDKKRGGTRQGDRGRKEEGGGRLAGGAQSLPALALSGRAHTGRSGGEGGRGAEPRNGEGVIHHRGGGINGRPAQGTIFEPPPPPPISRGVQRLAGGFGGGGIQWV